MVVQNFSILLYFLTFSVLFWRKRVKKYTHRIIIIMIITLFPHRIKWHLPFFCFLDSSFVRQHKLNRYERKNSCNCCNITHIQVVVEELRLLFYNNNKNFVFFFSSRNGMGLISLINILILQHLIIVLLQEQMKITQYKNLLKNNK